MIIECPDRYKTSGVSSEKMISIFLRPAEDAAIVQSVR